MFTRADITPLSIAASTAVLAGVAFGVWAGPPSHLAQPVFRGEAQPIYGDDPNLARYKQVIAEQGAAAPSYFMASYTPPAPAPKPEETALIESRAASDVVYVEPEQFTAPEAPLAPIAAPVEVANPDPTEPGLG